MIIANALPDAVANQVGQIAIMSSWAATVLGGVSLLRVRLSGGATHAGRLAAAGLIVGAVGMAWFVVIVVVASSGLTF